MKIFYKLNYIIDNINIYLLKYKLKYNVLILKNQNILINKKCLILDSFLIYFFLNYLFKHLLTK